MASHVRPLTQDDPLPHANANRNLLFPASFVGDTTTRVGLFPAKAEAELEEQKCCDCSRVCLASSWSLFGHASVVTLPRNSHYTMVILVLVAERSFIFTGKRVQNLVDAVCTNGIFRSDRTEHRMTGLMMCSPDLIQSFYQGFVEACVPRLLCCLSNK